MTCIYERFFPVDRGFEGVNVVVSKKYLVTVKGQSISQNDLTDYASAVDYENLKKF